MSAVSKGLSGNVFVPCKVTEGASVDDELCGCASGESGSNVVV